jgi:hypothetical protein
LGSGPYARCSNTETPSPSSKLSSVEQERSRQLSLDTTSLADQAILLDFLDMLAARRQQRGLAWAVLPWESEEET